MSNLFGFINIHIIYTNRHTHNIEFTNINFTKSKHNKCKIQIYHLSLERFFKNLKYSESMVRLNRII